MRGSDNNSYQSLMSNKKASHGRGQILPTHCGLFRSGEAFGESVFIPHNFKSIY